MHVSAILMLLGFALGSGLFVFGAVFSPSQAVDVSILDDVDVDIKDAAFIGDWDYNGKGDPVLALGITFLDAEGKEHDQYFSCGKEATQNFSVSNDGATITPTGEKQGLNRSCNATKFLESMVNAGFDESLFDSKEGVKTLVGYNVHLMQVEQERKGLVKQGDKKQTTLLVTNINSAPGQAKPAATAAKKGLGGKSTRTAQAAAPTPAAAKPNGKPAPAQAAAAAETEAVDIEAEAQSVVLELLQAGPLKKSVLPTKVFAAVKNSEHTPEVKKQIGAIVFKDEFLNAGPWTYEGGLLSLPS